MEKRQNDLDVIEGLRVMFHAEQKRCSELFIDYNKLGLKYEESRETIKRLVEELRFYRNAQAERKPNVVEEVSASGALGTKYAFSSGAKREKIHTGTTQIPLSALKAIGAIFVEGEQKYGRNNWKKALFDIPYQLEGEEHAYIHFREYIDRTSTDGSSPIQQLAKVAWFCVTQIDTITREELEKEKKEAICSAEQMELRAQTSSRSEEAEAPSWTPGPSHPDPLME